MRQLTVILLLSAAAKVSACDSSIADSELSIGGVALDSTEQQVLSLLGPPPRKIETGEGTEFRYDGLTVFVGWLEEQAPGKERHAYMLTGTGPRACTPAGICPGMPLSRATEAYGRPVVAERLAGTLLEYYSHESSCWLQLATSDETIRSVSAVCQP